MDSDSNDSTPSPKRLKTLVFNANFPNGNNLLHQFVLDNSYPNHTGSANYLNAVLLSMRHNVSVNALNNDGHTALYLAVMKDNYLMVKKLISCLVNIDLNRKCFDETQNTALHLAVAMGHLSIVQELLNRGAVIDVKNRIKQTPLVMAVQSGELEVIKLLAKKGADLNPETDDIHPLHRAIGNVEVMKFFFSQGVSINAKDLSGFTPLHFASRFKNLDAVKFLIDNDADVNNRNSYGNTPLLCAAMLGYTDIMKCLISNGAEIHAENCYGYSALHFVTLSGDLANVEYLVKNSADLNINRELTRCAARSGSLIVLKFFSDLGVQLFEPDDCTELLDDALESGNLEMIEYLIKKGANVNAVNQSGRTPLFSAMLMKNEELIKVLKKWGGHI